MKKYLSVILLMVLTLSLTACGKEITSPIAEVNTEINNAVEEVVTESEPINEDLETSQTVYPITVVDQFGREVEFKAAPEKIVSPYYITSSMLIGLGLADKIVGIEDNPEKRNIYGLSADYLLNLPTVGSLKNFDLEAVAALKPDLVLLPMKLKDMSANLDELGITNVIVNPESEELLAEMISIIGEVTDTTDRANELNEYIKSHTDDLVKKNESVSTPTVYLSGNSDFLLTAGEAMYQSSMITIAGGKNVAGDIEDTYWAEVDYEQILAWNPEYIILASAAGYTVEDVMNDKNLSMCDAVKNGNVYKIPSDIEAWDSPVPGAFLGSIWLESVLHPECVSTEEYEAAVKEFYGKFYGM